ncbi:hypothetical protein C0V68_06030, partial [Anaplasma phagocytophilum]
MKIHTLQTASPSQRPAHGRMRGMSHVLLGLYLGNILIHVSLEIHTETVFLHGNLIAITVKVAIHSRR